MSRLSAAKNRFAAARGITFMEVLVGLAIVLVLGAIAVPVYSTLQLRSHKTGAVEKMRQLGTAALTYAQQQNGELPAEEAKSTDSWEAAADPANAKAWYNVVPKAAGKRAVGEFLSTPRTFYSEENLLYVPAAEYPKSDRKLVRPLFAVAINGKLQRRDLDGRKAPVKLSELAEPSRTVLFLEQGLPSEKKSSAVQAKYDGSSKGSARTFVGRYFGEGMLLFADGRVDLVAPQDLLTETGKIPFPQGEVLWTRTPAEDPN